VDSDGSIVMTLFDSWKMNMFKLAPPSASTTTLQS